MLGQSSGPIALSYEVKCVVLWAFLCCHNIADPHAQNPREQQSLSVSVPRLPESRIVPGSWAMRDFAQRWICREDRGNESPKLLRAILARHNSTVLDPAST